MVAFIALVIVGSRWFVTTHTGLNLADWGYLWYGEWRTRLGEIPLLDFQSYDPGRFYYLAIMSSIFGDGIIGTRESLALVQWLAVTVALTILRRRGASWLQVCCCGLALTWWMWPDHKLVDSAFAIFTVAVALSLAKSDSSRSYFAAGAYAGLTAIFGRNHGVYAIAVFGGICLFLWCRERRRIYAGVFIGGVITGYSPMLIASLGVKGFYSAVLASVRVNISSGTNVPSPIPWPWRLQYAGLSPEVIASQFSTGMCFLLAYLGCTVALVYLIRAKWHRDDGHLLVLTTALTATTYLHHASVRADLAHLAQSSPPFLLLLAGALLSIAPKWRALAWGTTAAISLFAIAPAYAVVQRAFSPDQWVLRSIDHASLWIDRPTAEILDAVVAFDQAHHSTNEPIFLAPYVPALYRVLRQKSPTWEIYFVLPATPAANEDAIRQLVASGARYFILGDIPLDNRDDLRFRNTHPELYAYIRQHYRLIPASLMPAPYQAYERR